MGSGIGEEEALVMLLKVNPSLGLFHNSILTEYRDMR